MARMIDPKGPAGRETEENRISEYGKKAREAEKHRSGADRLAGPEPKQGMRGSSRTKAGRDLIEAAHQCACDKVPAIHQHEKDQLEW